MAEGVDTVIHHPITEEGKHTFMPKLLHHKPHQPPQQGNAIRIIIKRPKPTVKKILAEEQTGFRLLVEKHLDHQRELYHNFIDFKKAFDRIRRDGLWKVMRDYKIDEPLSKIIKALYEDATSAVLQNKHPGEFFRTTVGVRQ